MSDVYAVILVAAMVILPIAMLASAALWFNREADRLDTLPPPVDDPRSSISNFRRMYGKH